MMPILVEVDVPGQEGFMHYARLAILAISIGVGFVATAQTPTKTRPQANIAAGRDLFHQHCSVCYGVDAKGDGTWYDPQSRHSVNETQGSFRQTA